MYSCVQFFPGSETNDSNSSNNSLHCSMDEVLQLLRQLFIVTTKKDNVHIEAFNSKRITNKLVQQIQVCLYFSQLIVYVFKIR